MKVRTIGARVMAIPINLANHFDFKEKHEKRTNCVAKRFKIAFFPSKENLLLPF